MLVYVRGCVFVYSVGYAVRFHLRLVRVLHKIFYRVHNYREGNWKFAYVLKLPRVIYFSFLLAGSLICMYASKLFSFLFVSFCFISFLL